MESYRGRLHSYIFLKYFTQKVIKNKKWKKLKNINPSQELFVDFLLKNYEQFLLPPEDIFRAGNNLKTAISWSRLTIKKSILQISLESKKLQQSDKPKNNGQNSLRKISKKLFIFLMKIAHLDSQLGFWIWNFLIVLGDFRLYVFELSLWQRRVKCCNFDWEVGSNPPKFIFLRWLLCFFWRLILCSHSHFTSFTKKNVNKEKKATLHSKLSFGIFRILVGILTKI